MIRRLRLACGLIMLAYVTMHLANHTLGLVSLGAMARALDWVAGFWSQYLVLSLLYGACLVHYALALWALWERRTLRMHISEMLQLVFGFALPFLLVRHVSATRLAASFFDVDTGYYRYVLWALFVHTPWLGYLQLATLVVAWSHSMLGLYYWLRVRPWFEGWRAVALSLAVLFPVLSLLGVIEAGRQVAALAAEPGWTANAFAHLRLPTPEAADALDQIVVALQWSFIGVVTAVLLARTLRRLWRRRGGLVRIAYSDGRSIDVVPGTSVLEASRLAGMPHASVCGGRGRCSTCRVRVRVSAPGLPEPGELEHRVLRRIGAGPNIRLACQLRPLVPIEVTPLLPAFVSAAEGAARTDDLAAGRECEIAILFSDLRGFTSLAERQLPYDVVFVLNRYFAAMAQAVEEAGGRIDKFIGDGIMALFGLSGDAGIACREALHAACLMSLRLVELNQALRSELIEPLRIAIGIHTGEAIVGEIGHGGARTLTAIGNAVNIASRIETLAKQFECELLVSEDVVTRAGVNRALFRWEEIRIRGRRGALPVAIVDNARDLLEIVRSSPPPLATFL